MREECQEKDEDNDLIRALFDSISNVGKTWNNKSVDQIESDHKHRFGSIFNFFNDIFLTVFILDASD